MKITGHTRTLAALAQAALAVPGRSRSSGGAGPVAPEDATAEATTGGSAANAASLDAEELDGAGRSSMRVRLRLPKGLGPLFRRNRMLAVTAGVGAALLLVGLLLGRYIVPAGAQEETTPQAGLATVPVAYGKLSNVVTMRGEVSYSDSVDVKVDSSASSGQAIVTGHVPETDSELDSLSVALEVAGRPLIVLPGKLPAYRTLEIGMSGPDVKQFKRAMRSVHIDAGDPSNSAFTAATAAAIDTLYSRIGYSPPAKDESAATALTDARSAVQSANLGVSSAKDALHRARKGPTSVSLRQADNAVASAQRALNVALDATPQDPNQIADLRDALALAKLERRELHAKPDTRAEQLALTSARAGLTSAEAALATAKMKASPVLPVSEVLFLDHLPRRVDSVEAVVGAVLADKAMTVSGATLGLSGTVSEGDAKLIKTGTEATFELPDGGQQRAVVAEIVPGSGDDARPTIRLTPDPLTSAQVKGLADTNVRVQVPVGSTQTEVLSVPAAALTAGPGGETRVVVVDSDPRDGANAKTHVVTVDTGLAAQGVVEIRPREGTLKAGDLVVVGR